MPNLSSNIIPHRIAVASYHTYKIADAVFQFSPDRHPVHIAPDWRSLIYAAPLRAWQESNDSHSTTQIESKQAKEKLFKVSITTTGSMCM